MNDIWMIPSVKNLQNIDMNKIEYFMFHSMRQKKRILRKQPFKICIIKFDKKCYEKKDITMALQ